MRTASVKLVLALVLALAATAAAHADYGAIAYSPSTGNWGYSAGSNDLGAVENDAIARANAGDAQITVWVQNGWAALATGDDGAYGWGWSGNSQEDAENIALSNAGNNASVACWVFSGR